MKRAAGRAQKRARVKTKRTKAKAGQSKSAHIVALVQALSAELGGPDGEYLGGNIIRLMADLYAQGGRTVPRWLRELMAHYRQET